MPTYAVSIKDTASPAVQALAAAGKSGLLPAVGEAGKLGLVEHFAGKQSDPSSHGSATALGAKPSGLFADFARSTSWDSAGDGVTLTVSHPAARQRWKGGTIRPVNGSFLTLPANSYAYGHRAREVGVTLKFMYAPDPVTGEWRPALVAPDAVTKPTGKARKDGTRRERTVRPSGIYYWLIRKATQRSDDTVLPPDDSLLERIGQALRGWLAGVLGKGPNG